MVYKIFFISIIFFCVVNIWEPGNAMPSESIVAKSQKRNIYEEHMDKAPNEKDSPEILQQDNNKKMLPVANASLHDKDSPIIYFNINKFNIRQYKGTSLDNIEKEIMYDEVLISDNLNINDTLDKLKQNITILDSKHDEGTQTHQETIGNLSRRLSPIISDKLSQPDVLPTTKNSPSNETQQLPTFSISRNNDPTNCDSDINEKANEENYRRIFDGQRLQDLDVIEISDVVTNQPRLCYVCNSIYDPSCWSPGRKTVVKYCREQQFCLTHLHIHDGAKYMVRECGSTCVSSTVGKSSESFASCTVCYTDLCNEANYLKAQNFILLIPILFKLLKN